MVLWWFGAGAVGSRQINMESIFHEKQEGSLCAQHCLNNLLQGEYFIPVELSSIAHQLDEEERMRMAEGGVTSEDYRTFLQVPILNLLKHASQKMWVLFRKGWAALLMGIWLVNYNSALGFVDGNAQDVILNTHTNDTLPFSPHPQSPPQPSLQIQQQPSGNMDDSGFFSIQVSSHKHVLSVVYIPGTKLSVCFSQPFIVTVLMWPSKVLPVGWV